ncbi:hypothetical protein B0H14DRAFT_3523814 [Mycena olivaceomarginata]|nr:hypothetical protein B0H14DRAFT_3523814 [Mycena olivaceomarginata]
MPRIYVTPFHRGHYDFYSWFLGLRVIYTSGVMLSPDTFESLETLQDNKLTIVCKKLDLKPTHRLLLLLGHPCGYAAKNFGVTLGKNQAKFGTERIAHNGIPADKPHTRTLDRYRHSILDPQSVHRARTPRMTLTWGTGGRGSRSGKGKATKNSNEAESRNIRQLNRWPEYPTASLLLSIAMKFMLTSLDDVQTTQTDSNATKTMALDHLGGMLEVLKYMLLCKVILNLPEDVHTLVESMRAITWAHQDRNLADFEKAPRDYKDKLSSELTIRSHLAMLYNTLLESPSLRPPSSPHSLPYGGDVPALVASFLAPTFVSNLAHLRTSPPPHLSSFHLCRGRLSTAVQLYINLSL